MQFPEEFTTEKVIINIGSTEQNVNPSYYFTGLTFTSTDIMGSVGTTLTKEQILDAVLEGFKVITEKLAEVSNAPQAFLRSESISVRFEGTAHENNYVDTTPEEV